MAYARNLDNWDPMAENYHDVNINSYEHGPGVNLTPYANRSVGNSEYKLYVNNIPVELTEDGIRSIFKRYGNPLGVMSPPETSWAFVTYGTFREAETAIRELNNTEPLKLTVAFAKKKEKESNKKNPIQVGIPHTAVPPPLVMHNQRREYISSEHCQRPNQPRVVNLGRGRELAALARRVIAPSPGRVYHENDDLLYPAIHDPEIYDPYEEAGPYPDTTNMWARGRLQINDDGTRYVTMGRGYTWYELPTQHPRVDQQIRAVYENRETGNYEYGKNKVHQIGKCQNCAQTATGRCSRCGEFYCSEPCQKNDWPRHKIECQSMPGFMEVGVDSASASISSGEEVPQKKPMVRTARRLRRPMTNPAPLSVPDCTSTPLPGASPSRELPSEIPVETSKMKEGENEPSQSQDNLKRNYSGTQKPILDHSRTCNSGGWKPMKNGGDNRPLHRSDNHGSNTKSRFNSSEGSTQQLPKEEYVAKKPASQSSSQGSFDRKNSRSQNAAVSPSKIIEKQQPPKGDQANRNLFKRTNLQQKSYEEVTNQVQKMAIKENETAKPVSKPISKPISKPVSKPLLPDPDFGFYSTANMPETSDVKTQKVSFKEPKDNAVAGTSGTKNRLEALVQTRDEIKPMNSTVASIPSSKANIEKEKNVVELLGIEEQGCFEVHVLLGNNKAAVTVCVLKYHEEYAKISSMLTPMCNSLPKPLLFKPKVGDFVCGKRLDDWVRGTIVSLGPPIRLAVADEGRIEPVTDLKPIPKDFINLPMMGAICELTKGDFKLEPMEQYTFVVIKKISENVVNDGLEIVMYSTDEKEAYGVLKPWVPAPEQKGIPYATLTSGTEVHLASFRSHILIFVRSLAPEALAVFRQMTQDVARCSTKAPQLTEPPIIGEIVMAKYAEDGNFYRAIVRKITGQMITVSYVDYGNIETTTLENIRSISPNLKEYPSCAAKIVLKDVPKDVAITKEANNYLAKLAGTEEPLMCTFEGSPSTDGVLLKTANGTSVNDKIIELLTPSWKKEEDKTTVFMIDDLDVAELGTVGQTVNVVTLFAYGALMYAMAPQDMEVIEHVTGVMAAQMEEYCKQLKDHYIPRQGELCLAPYEGLWYRAVCVETNTTPTASSVNFIDFGNLEVIDHKDLRVMIKDFMTTKTLASICQVVGLGPVDENGNLPEALEARIKELVLPNNVTLIKIVECTKPGDYVVELPEVKEILIKEGLLKL